MTDSTSVLSVLANAGLRVFTQAEHERLVAMCRDWVYSRNQYRKCSVCGSFGDEDMDGAVVEPGVNEWWCADCIRDAVEDALDDDASMSHLFATINRAGEK